MQGVNTIKPLETNPQFTNRLVNSASPYLRQHAHNPVFWYPWGKEAIERARTENKPIHLSIGYSACYWCHVMEREVFENLSIASLMNRTCVNIKVDREELPAIDEIYMVARQIMTKQGGWPNTLFLTPGLKPFYAGGTYAADESDGRASFPRLLEWLNYVWTTQEEDVRKVADEAVTDMTRFLVVAVPENAATLDISARAGQLYGLLKQFHDMRSGGFFQSPKFPHETYLGFLLGYHEATGEQDALQMVERTLQKMAAGGIYDQVGCGFHRYAVDKEWYVPHFEKMLYNQAQLARIYTDAARITGNPYFADIAKGVLEAASGPLLSAQGAFYAALDAETEGVEGAYYAWSADELQKILTPQEIAFLTTFYALADIPHFPGHKKVEGQVLILRKSLDEVARERTLPYVELAALCGEVMNKLLTVRNKRISPRLDDKVIVSWNGLMIDALAHAGKVFGRPGYTARAREAADFLLDKAIDNHGRLHRVYAGGKAQLDAVLEDYAYLVKGLLSLWKVTPDAALLESAVSLMTRANELFADGQSGYFATQVAGDIIIRIKNCDDSATASANAVMAHNLIDLFEITKEQKYLEQAQLLIDFFLKADEKVQPEHACLVHAGLRCQMLAEGKVATVPATYDNDSYKIEHKQAPRDTVATSLTMFPADAKPGDKCELLVTLDIREGWHINATKVTHPFLIPTQLDIQGAELLDMKEPEALKRPGEADGETLLVYEGLIAFTARIRLPKEEKSSKIKVMLRYQACNGTSCYAARDIVLAP